MRQYAYQTKPNQSSSPPTFLRSFTPRKKWKTRYNLFGRHWACLRPTYIETYDICATLKLGTKEAALSRAKPQLFGKIKFFFWNTKIRKLSHTVMIYTSKNHIFFTDFKNIFEIFLNKFLRSSQCIFEKTQNFDF